MLLQSYNIYVMSSGNSGLVIVLGIAVIGGGLLGFYAQDKAIESYKQKRIDKIVEKLEKRDKLKKQQHDNIQLNHNTTDNNL